MQLEWIIALQNALPDWLKQVFVIITHAGDLEVILCLWALCAWLVAPRKGVAFILTTLLGLLITSIFMKAYFAIPRPFMVSPEVTALVSARGYAFPSGHAFLAMLAWGGVRKLLNDPWLRALCIFMIVGIGVSRVVIGVHYPSDVIAGWMLGAAFLYLLSLLWSRDQLHSTPLLISIPVLLTCVFSLWAFGPEGIPPTWLEALSYAWVATVVGHVLHERWIRYAPSNNMTYRYIHCALGIGLLFAGMQVIADPGLRFGFAILWITAGAPALFKHCSPSS